MRALVGGSALNPLGASRCDAAVEYVYNKKVPRNEASTSLRGITALLGPLLICILRFMGLPFVFRVKNLDQVFDVAIDCNIPLWRCLSATGMVQQPRFSGVNYKQKLLEEDHELVTKGNGNPVVSDYKKTEFDYSQLKIMPAEEALKPLTRWEIPSMKKAITKVLSSRAIARGAEQDE